MELSKEEWELIEDALEYIVEGESEEDSHFGQYYKVLHKVSAHREVITNG